MRFRATVARRLLVIVGVLALVLASSGLAFADGTETLGEPSISIAAGSGVAAAGVGVADPRSGQPGTINVNVPGTVVQVLLYWEGQNTDATFDDTINVDGNAVTGTLIGGPTRFFARAWSSTLRADITALGLVGSGPNALTIDGMDFTRRNNGAGVLVIYDDGTEAEIGLRDGNDLAFIHFAPPLDSTVPQTFTFAAEAIDRVATLTIFASSVSSDGPRPSVIEATLSDGSVVTFDDVLDSTDGNEWDTFVIPVDIPSGVTSLTVEAKSESSTGELSPVPASFTWSAAALSVPVTAGGVCLVIIDEDSIDNGMSTIEAAAASHGVESAYLVNDDMPTEVGNPWLRWNLEFPGDTVLLPTGEVDDEGWFALPEDTPWSLQDYVDGVVPQSQLDKIADVMPLRNQDLASLVGETCVAVVYDSDISMNYEPINANMQGARYGLFAFTVKDAVSPGTIPESQSDTSLYDMLVTVEGPLQWTERFDVVIHDHEPDSIEIDQAHYSDETGVVTVFGTSDAFSGNSVMTVSIEGFVFEAPMTYNASADRYEYVVDTGGIDLDGRRVSIQNDHGGAYNETIS